MTGTKPMWKRHGAEQQERMSEAAGYGMGTAIVAWPESHPSDFGWDPALGERIDRYAAERLPKLHGFVLVCRGVLVLERYYNGSGPGTLMDVRSVTKSFTGAAVGLAIRDGLLGGVEDRIGTYLPPDSFSRASETPNLTIRELLSMSSGLYWKTGSKLGEAYIRRMHQSKDWLRFILRLPVDPEQRGRFVYRSPDSHLLSCLVTRVNGQSAAGYLKERLFVPLGITDYEWNSDPQGNTAGHVFLRMGCRDLAKFGQLMLDHGRWGGGSELIPESWVKASLRAQSGGMPSFGEYGYQWWIRRICGIRTAYAWGHGGNFIMLLPSLQAVAVAVSDPAVNRWRDPRSLMEQVVLPGMGAAADSKDRQEFMEPVWN